MEPVSRQAFGMTLSTEITRVHRVQQAYLITVDSCALAIASVGSGFSVGDARLGCCVSARLQPLMHNSECLGYQG
jgi:hypothetical protein